MTAGTIVTVTPDWRGDTLAAATLTTDTVLHVEDPTDFDEDGGWATIGASAPMAYLTCDDEASTVTLAAAAGAVFDVGDPVRVWDPTVSPAGAHVVEYVAVVELDNGSASVAVPHELIPSAGVDNLEGASVSVVESEGQWQIGEVFGREAVVDQGFIDTPFVTLYQASDVSWIDNSFYGQMSAWSIQAEVPQAFDYDPLTGRLTIVEAGLYLFTLAVNWAGNTSGRRYIQLVTELAGVASVLRTIPGSPPDTTSFTQQIVVAYQAAVGEVVYVEAHQTSGANLAIRGDAAGRLTMWQAVRLQA